MRKRVLRQGQNRQGAEAHFPIDELTGRELEVFKMMGQGLTVDVIADRLGIDQKTVQTHRRQVKEKLGYNTIDQVISHAARWIQAKVDGDLA